MSDTGIKKIVREVVREELAPVEQRFDQKLDYKFALFENKIIEGVQKLLYEFRSDLTKMKLEIVGEIQDFREENTIVDLKNQHQRIINMDESIEKLQKIHPQYTHQFA